MLEFIRENCIKVDEDSRKEIYFWKVTHNVAEIFIVNKDYVKGLEQGVSDSSQLSSCFIQLRMKQIKKNAKGREFIKVNAGYGNISNTIYLDKMAKIIEGEG